MNSHDTADAWYAAQDTFHDHCQALRAIALGVGLTETLKWRHPCYMDNGKNVLIISFMKDAAVASFLKGALIEEHQGRFIQPGADRSARYLRYPTVESVHADRAYLEDLLHKAIAAERAGLRVPPLPDEIDYVDELEQRMATDAAFREAFEALTPGRRRGYNIHFGKAKQSSTREARIDRATERIFMGKGLMDCICGRSKRKGRCDGSHKKPV